MFDSAAPPLRFGDFEWICHQASLTVCPALGLGDPACYSRNIGMNSFLLFQPAVLAVALSAMVVTMIMIWHVRRKYTAVGRKEMVIFFYLFLLSVGLELLLMTGILPMPPSVYKIFAAAHVAAITATCFILLMNGFVGFQWAEDGTNLSVWMFRIAAIAVGAVAYFIAICTFHGALGFSRQNPIVLYIILFIFNGAALLVYFVLQMFLVLCTLNDMWPLGNLLLGALFLAMGMISMLLFSNHICQFAQHYVDGMFLGSSFVLLSVMMVYKYWDSITTEDLEFAVGNTQQVWHIRNTMNLPLQPYKGGAGVSS